jgi:hypothetical protein
LRLHILRLVRLPEIGLAARGAVHGFHALAWPRIIALPTATTATW